MSNKILLKCQLCDEEIAEVLLDKLKLPLRGFMFGPKGEGYHQPFPPEVDWQIFKCPYCNYIPFLIDEQLADDYVNGRCPGPSILFTDWGTAHAYEYLGVPMPKDEEEFRCDVCNKPFKSKQALNGHKGKHKLKKEKVANV